MKILIVVPKFKDGNEIDYDYIFPLGLGYISSALKKKGHKVDCLNLNHHNGTIEELINNQLNKNNYDFVCTGGMAFAFSFIKQIIDIVKKHNSKARTIIGGLIVTSEPKVMFDLLNPDFAVVGEGEEIICDLLDCIDKQNDFHNVKGLLFRDKEGDIIFTGKKESIQDLDSLPYPDFEGLDFENYLDNLYCNTLPNAAHNSFDHPRAYPILGSRGCPFNCTFCYHYDKYRKRSLESIKQELHVMVKRYRINRILFFDECLALDKNRLWAICKMIKELRSEISWELKWSPQLTVLGVDEEMLRGLHDSGADTISYGFESMSPIVLKSMNKPITPEMISSVFHNTLKAGMGIVGNFIFGDIAETKETAQVTLDWWKNNSKGQINLLFIQPYPGSKIYEHCLRKGIIKDKIDFIQNRMRTTNWYNITDSMNDKELEQLKNTIIVLNLKYRYFAKPTLIKKTQENIYELKVKCPFCKNVLVYKNLFIEKKRKRLYGFPLVCRKCHLTFFVVSFVRRIIYRSPDFVLINLANLYFYLRRKHIF